MILSALTLRNSWALCEARLSSRSNPLILLRDSRLACLPRRSDHGKIYRIKFFLNNQ